MSHIDNISTQRLWNSQGEVVLHKAAVPEQAGPQLDAHNAEYEEDEEAEQQHIAQHGQGVQEQGHQDTHTWGTRTWSNSWRAQYANTHTHTLTHTHTHTDKSLSGLDAYYELTWKSFYYKWRFNRFFRADMTSGYFIQKTSRYKYQSRHLSIYRNSRCLVQGYYSTLTGTSAHLSYLTHSSKSYTCQSML